jgi:hypothetical protein
LESSLRVTGNCPFDGVDPSWDRRRFGDLTSGCLVARMKVKRGRVAYSFVFALMGNKLRTI